MMIFPTSLPTIIPAFLLHSVIYNDWSIYLENRSYSRHKKDDRSSINIDKLPSKIFINYLTESPCSTDVSLINQTLSPPIINSTADIIIICGI